MARMFFWFEKTKFEHASEVCTRVFILSPPSRLFLMGGISTKKVLLCTCYVEVFLSTIGDYALVPPLKGASCTANRFWAWSSRPKTGKEHKESFTMRCLVVKCVHGALSSVRRESTSTVCDYHISHYCTSRDHRTESAVHWLQFLPEINMRVWCGLRNSTLYLQKSTWNLFDHQIRE